MGRIFSYMGLGSRVGLEGTKLSVWWRSYSLEAGLSSACRLLGCTRAVEFHQVWGQGPAPFLVLGWDGERHRICPGILLGSELQGILAERPVTDLFFQLVWFALCLCSLLELSGRDGHRENIQVYGFGHRMGLGGTELSAW